MKTIEELQAELATLKAEKAAAEAKAKADLEAATAAADAAVKADRERRTAIMNLEEAKGREALAEHLFAAGNTVEQAKATLAVAPAANAETPENYEAARMAGAELNGGGGGGDKQTDTKAQWAKVIARANKRFNK